MKRRYLVGLFLLIGLVLLNACSISHTPKSNAPKSTLNKIEELYGELSSNANSPKMLKYSDQFNQKITFVAQVDGEPLQVKSKDDTLDGEWYVSVFLMRNRNTPMYLNLSSIKKESWPKNGDILRIDGIPIGYLYTSYNNERLDLLDIKANAIERLDLKKADVPSTKIMETEQYKVEIIGSDILSDTFDDPSLVVYYTFKNKKDYTATSPIRTYFFFSQKEKQLEVTILDDDNKKLNSKALHRDTLESGEEMLYYEVFKLLDAESTVDLNVYDDEYNLLNTIKI